MVARIAVHLPRHDQLEWQFFAPTVLFVAGVMNLLWVAVLAGLVLLEKVLPNGPTVARVAGVGFIVWGLWLAAGSLLA